MSGFPRTEDSSFKFKAEWITAQDVQEKWNACLQFHSAFELEEIPEKAPLRIAAESVYRLYVNGIFAGCGPVRGTCAANYFDTYEIRKMLHKGVNHVAALVHSHLTDTFIHFPAGCGVIVELPGVLSTGETWKARQTPGWICEKTMFTCQQGYRESRDLRLESGAWLCGAGVGQWKDARHLKTQRLELKSLKPREIPALRETSMIPVDIAAMGKIELLTPEEGEDVSALLNRENWLSADAAAISNSTSLLSAEGGDCELHPAKGFGAGLVFDFGTEFIGYFDAEIEAPAGTRLEIVYGETPWAGHGRLRAAEIDDYRFTDSYVLREGTNRVGNLFTERGGRYVQLVFRDFAAPIKIKHIRMNDRRYPYSRRAEFFCDDYRLNRIWEVCRETMEACTTDIFLDCPWREHSFWVNDYVVENIVSLALFGATPVHQRAFEMAFSQQRPDGWVPGVCPAPGDGNERVMILPATNLFLFIMLHDYWMRSGRLDIAAQYLPNLARILENVEASADKEGRVCPPESFWNFYDWGFELDDIVFNGQRESMFCSLYIRALRIYLELAEASGHQVDREDLLRRIERTKRAVSGFVSKAHGGRLADPAFKRANLVANPRVTLDGRNERTQVVSQLSHALALLAGAAPLECKKVFEEALNAPDALEPELYLSSFVFQAMCQAGRQAEALERIRSRWGRCIDTGTTTLYEAAIHRFGIVSFEEHGSLCHGFGTFPAVFLQQEILGVEALAAGYSEFSFAPKSLGLEFAKGRIPAPHGNIEVSWRRDGAALAVELRVPLGTEAVLPDKRRFPCGTHKFQYEESAS